MYGKKIDEKWQKKWEESKIYDFDNSNLEDIYYVLSMFSYPSGSKLHVGHWFNYAPVDTFARFKKMKGYNVFQPMGFDAFGLPAENYAVKTGVHPMDSTKQNIENMEKQLKELGGAFAWNHEIITSEPEYYKWTQWLFSYLYKKGLAYKKKAPVNYCPHCNTVLANEQVIQGRCERCGTLVERRKLSQWFFKITDYAERLLDGLEDLEWPNLTKKIQKNWIGKSVGAEVNFEINGKRVPVFTTRVDTIYGATFLAIAPESDLASSVITSKYRKEAEEYIRKTNMASELERQFTDREKTGVFTGTYAKNLVTGKEVPVYLADYVLEGYGSAAVMGVPAHDLRDYEFALNYHLDIMPTNAPKGDSSPSELPFISTDDVVMINSEEFNGLDIKEAQDKIIEKIEKDGIGERKIQYKLKDWLVSRQRYWGAPIPIVYCPEHGEQLVKDSDLPVKLPYDVEFRPDGHSPLAKSEEFVNGKCPVCGKDAKREVDTLDTFVCSSWYQLRYPYPNLDAAPFKVNEIDNFVPVDVYVGGKEHAAMHLIYSRFIYKALADGGLVNSEEPFKKLIHQGLILGPDGNKMSKSKGNTVSPDEYVDKYGSDVLRMYMMFGMTYEEGGPWDEDAINAMSKYLVRVQKLYERLFEENNKTENMIKEKKEISKEDLDSLRYVIHTSIRQIESDMDRFSFNTAVAKLMEIVNEIIRIENIYGSIDELKDAFKTFVVILAPFAPHLSEELWAKLGNETSVHKEDYPKFIEEYTKKSVIEIAVQVNGKLRGLIEISEIDSKDEVLKRAKEVNTVQNNIEGKTIVKEIYVPGKIVNIVVK